MNQNGCSHLQALRWVILPLTLPGLSACTIYLLIVSWSEFIFARTLMRSGLPFHADRRHAVLRRRT